MLIDAMQRYHRKRNVPGIGATSAILIVAWCALATEHQAIAAAEWACFRGPRHNGISDEKGWLAQWPAQGPRRLWQMRVGAGYSCVAISKGRLYTIGNQDGMDTVFCVNAATGRVLWKQSYRCVGGEYPGPRATPTVDGDRVYTLSREAQLYCFNSKNGAVLWSRDLKKDHRLASPGWGFAGSPLIEGRLVILNAGTAGLAVDKVTGKTIWHSGGDAAGYATPVAFSMGGQRCVAIFTKSGVVGVDPRNGNKLWNYPWKTSYDVNAADPIIDGNRVFISSGYGKGCALLQVGKGEAKVIWQNRNMKNHFHTSILLGGFLYGNDEGALRCVNFDTGEAKWRRAGIGKGQLTAADGKLIILTERGELVIALATPKGYAELSRAHVLTGTCWTAPVLCGGRIYCRNHEGELVCLDVMRK